jgi:PhnB protein
MKSGCQVYVKGSAEAVALYQKAFNLVLNPDMIHMMDDGVTYIHASLMSGENEIVAVGEDIENWCNHETTNNKCPLMAFNVYELGTREAVDYAYSVLSEEARINNSPNGPSCPFWDEDGNEYWFDLVDKFGVRWGVGK